MACADEEAAKSLEADLGDRVSPARGSMAVEMREDPLTGALVALAAHRQERPNLPVTQCPFCVGGLEAPERYMVRTFPNRWPLFPDGRCEVVLYTPDHDAFWWTIGEAAATKIVDVWAERTAVLGRRTDVAYVLVFENRGADVGATISHPHGQIFAYEAVPPVPAAELRRCADIPCPLCTEQPGDRIVSELGGWRAWVPYASAHPYSLVIAPLAHEADLPSMSDLSRREFAKVLVDVLHRLDLLWGRAMPSMMWIHQRPSDGGNWPQAHVHAEIAVPLRRPGVHRFIAAAELGGGVFVNPVVPEQAAASLRATKP